MAAGFAPRGKTPPGRAGECAELDRLLDDVRHGESRALVLRGEAGVGKTTLLRYLVDAAPDVALARAAGVESEMELAFAGLHQLCGPMLDRLPRLPAPQRQALRIVFGLSAGPAPDQFLVGLAVLTLLSEAADERPLLCVIDDAQWLDRGSALTLGFVARRLLAEPVGIVFAAREPPEELQAVARLEVEGLPPREARALLSSTVRLGVDERVLDRIILETHGNPLALLELPRGLTATELAGGFGIPAAQGVSERIQQSFVRRVEALGTDARRLVLLAAAEPVGDPLLLWRGAQRLGIEPAATEEAAGHGLLTIGERVAFLHPLARSAVYRAAPVAERRAVHLALAEATDPEVDPDRRAWHLAAAAEEPDDDVAAELERSAGRAEARGGLAAAAAFLERAAALTRDPVRRVERALTAARTWLQAGAFDEALGLLAAAHAGPLDEHQRARADLLRAEISFAANRGPSAPASLLRAAKPLEPLDPRLARAGYLQALSAASFAARLAGPGAGVRDVADAVRTAPAAPGGPTAADLFLEGWAALFAEGSAAASPTLQAALARFDDGEATAQRDLIWMATATAVVVWDDERWDALSRLDLELARSAGALTALPLALSMRAVVQLYKGRLETAEAMLEEARLAGEATGAGAVPAGTVEMAARRGREEEAVPIFARAAADSVRRGEGIGLSVVAFARAYLSNGLGRPDEALPAAEEAIACPTNSAVTGWSMVEAIEAAARLGRADAAAELAGRFAEIAAAAGTDWALGVNARSAALVRTGPEAEVCHREALARLERCRMAPDRARAHLLYGEWLRRERRQDEARAQLRAAHEQFASMRMEAFAERARGELAATGERIAGQPVPTPDELTVQERQIARLARDGLSNPEIGARLFLSPRTVEWHLRKVFPKLGIRSRRELFDALPADSP